MYQDEIEDMIWGNKCPPDKSIVTIYLCQMCDYLTAEKCEIQHHYYDKHIEEIKERYNWDEDQIVYNLCYESTRLISIPTETLEDIAKEMNLIKEPEDSGSTK